MSPRTITVSREELVARREAILANLGMSLEEFQDRIERESLIGDEWYAAEDLDEIEFLLRDDPAA